MTASTDGTSEEAIVFGTNSRLVGIVTSPSSGDRPVSDMAVVLLNAGIVHRVGPNRLYVGLARELARMGMTALRFDHSGIGDSPPRQDQLEFEHAAVLETLDAVEWLTTHKSCQRFALLGLCSGTRTAFKVAQSDARVTSLVFLTAFLRDPSDVPAEVVDAVLTKRVARSYATEKIHSGTAWRRVLTGQADYRRLWRTVTQSAATAVRSGVTDPAAAQIIDQVSTTLRRGVSILFVFPEPTAVLEYFRMTVGPVLPQLHDDGRLEVVVIRNSDHTFTPLRHQRQVVDVVSRWITAPVPAPRA
jgi:alpha/beta superfamily hydrolase